MLLKRLVRGTAAVFALFLLAPCCSSVAHAQTTISEQPSWASTPANLVYAPQAGTSKIAYVHPEGNDATGQVWTYTSGNIYLNPTNKLPFETEAGARAAIADHQGPHAILFAAGPGVPPHRHIIDAAAKGENASQPFLFGAYYPGGEVPAARAYRQAVIDPGPGNSDTAVEYHTIAGPWAAEGGGVYSVNIGAGESEFKGVRVSPPAYIHLETVTSPATPAEGECVYDGATGELLVRLVGDVDPNTRTVEWRENNCGNIVTIVSGSGFGNLILQNLRVATTFRMVGGSSYDEYDPIAAVQPENGWGALFMYGGTNDVVLFDGCDFKGTAEGVVIQGVDKTDADRIEYATLDNCVIYNVWAEGGTQEGIYAENCYRLRVFDSFIIANGWNINDPVLGPGDTAQGRCHNVYLSFCEDPWIDNTVIALGSNAGIQMRCGGTGTRLFFYANADNWPMGHGQNDYENRLWRYTCTAADYAIYCTKPVGDTNTNGAGRGWGRCDTLTDKRGIIVGQDLRRANGATGTTYAFSLGTTPGTSSGGGTIVVGAITIESPTVFDWNYGAAGTAASFTMQSGASTGATSVTIKSPRVYERGGYAFHSQGTQTTTRARWESTLMHLGRFDLGPSATLYGPSGRSPRPVTGGGVFGPILRPGASMEALHTTMGYASEDALIAAWVAGTPSVNAVSMLNKVRPKFNYSLLRGGSVAP